MIRHHRRGILLASAATLAFTSAAQAQTNPAPASAATGVVGEVVVTGTRLQASGFTTPTPVTVESQERIQDRAKVNIAEALNEIPSFQPTAGPGQAQRNVSGQQGASTIDLRGLGAGRTLVLLDGRRYVPVAPSGVVDVSVVPTNLIQRVEVVTGGASAQYGSDAVAGVVNFILNDKLEGLKATAQYGFSEHGDALEPAINLAVGHAFLGGRLHVIAGADWSRNDGIDSQYDRDWGRKETGIVSLGANRPAGVPANVLADYQQFSGLTTGGLITSGPLTGTAFDAKGNPYKFTYGSLVGPTLMVGGPNNVNYGNSFTSQQHLLNPTERLSTLARANFELTPDVTLYGEFSYARDVINTLGYSLQNLGSTNLSQAGTSPTGGFLITADNPYLNPATLALMQGAGVTSFTLGKLSTDLGLWHGQATTTVMRGVAGAKGQFAGGWKWDAYFQDGDSAQSNLMFPTNKARLFAAAWAKPGPNGPVCGPISTNPYFATTLPAAERANRIADLGTAPCVPLDLFGTNVNSPAVQAYIRSAFNQQVVVRQYVASANVSGTPFSTWAGPVSVAVGGEFRRDSAYQSADPDNVGLRGGFLEFNGTPLSGSNDVGEGFFETGIPLLKDSMFGKALNLNGAVRETHYQLSGYVTTWKVGGTYDPVDWFRIRATRSRDIAAPRISQLYAQGGGANYVVTNPVNHVTDSVQGRTNGNPDLQPEVADTFTGGFVFSPKWDWARGFRASVDYYDITINGVISSLQPPQIVDRYYRLGQTQYASNFFFDSSALGFSRVTGTFANLTQLKASGVDIEADYRAPIDRLHVPGQLNIAALASYANQLATIDTSGGVRTVTDRVGQTTGAGTQGGPIPKWRETVTFDYGLGRFAATLQARIFSGFVANSLLVGPNSPNYSPSLSNSINDNFAPGGIYWNMQLRYDIRRTDQQLLQAFLNIDNLFDKDPPAYALSLTSAGGIPYDFTGRAFKVGFRLTM
jgi:outer membrane receptor protein involved in Fe transport